jgi:hypothetical protein
MMTNEELRGAIAKAAVDAGISLDSVGYKVLPTGDIKVRIVKGNVVQCAYMEHIPLCMNVHVESGDLAGWSRLSLPSKYASIHEAFRQQYVPESAQPGYMGSEVAKPVMETLGNEGPPPIQVIERAKGLTLDHLAKAEGLVRSDGEADGSLRWRLKDTLKATQAPPPAHNSDTFRQDLAKVFGLASDAPDEVLLSTATKAWEDYDNVESYTAEIQSIHNAEMDKRMNDHARMADRCGDLEHENKRLRERLGALLVDSDDGELERVISAKLWGSFDACEKAREILDYLKAKS